MSSAISIVDEPLDWSGNQRCNMYMHGQYVGSFASDQLGQEARKIVEAALIAAAKHQRYLDSRAHETAMVHAQGFLTLAEFMGLEEEVPWEDDDYAKVDMNTFRSWTLHWERQLFANVGMIHAGDCTKIPSSCVLCMIEDTLSNYANYRFGKGTDDDWWKHPNAIEFIRTFVSRPEKSGQEKG